MNNIKNFKELSNKDTKIAGGKGASLGEMINAKISVPNGFVVLASAFDKFMRDTNAVVEENAMLDRIDIQSTENIETQAEIMRDVILKKKFPDELAKEILKEFDKLGAKHVAVRSSATAEDSKIDAWAGQLDSFLYITKDNLLESVQKCWASLYTPRALFYRVERNMRRKQVSVAVVIQKMANSDVSGVCFTVHPVTRDKDQMIIESCWGLGEALVQGIITPDSYVIEKSTLNIIDINIGDQEKQIVKAKIETEEKPVPKNKREKQKLTEKQIKELAKICINIEKHYKDPRDIEWALEGNKFYIVQSRPITTLTDKTEMASSPNKKTSSMYKFNDYVRMFAGKSFYYIFSDIFLQYYNTLGVISIQDSENWMSFLPKISKQKTLKEGKNIYTNKKLFNKYNKKFRQYISSTSKYFESVLGKSKLNAREVRKFLDLASKHFFYYAKTEFFYTDLIDQEKMVISVAQFDKLKLDGRAFLNKILFRGDGYLMSLIKKVSNQTKVLESDIFFYSIEEFVELVKSKRKVDVKKIKARHLFFHSREDALFGEDSKELVDTFISKYQEISNVIRGSIANKGKVQGKARVFYADFRNFDKLTLAVKEMQKGEILIAESTAPEIIVACKKAGAIVTNQGGMLSHAAIISRELGIPCIVGTDKDIVLNVHTGDIIEVNANRGIVKILKTKKLICKK